ncbi:hypothetical protein BASA81_010993 [Batrachochytrium salamandrivorans]|nr:hypothetical protein BASA81_010993 [Batrachochytrium salamandrivorans]
MSTAAFSPGGGGSGGSFANRTRQPDFRGILYIKERARRRLSAFIEGRAKKDVLNGSDRTTTRRRSLSNQFDGPPVIKKYYFELCGHLLQWFDGETALAGAAPQPKGMVSVLSSNGIHRLTKEQVPSPFIGGFCVSDASSDLLPRRGDLLLYSDNSLQLANWFGLLDQVFRVYHCNPLAELDGPTQAANFKPILQGEILCRDTLDGLALDTWTKLHVSLFDNRLECRSLHQQANEPRRRASLFKTVASSLLVPTVRVDLLTVNFYVGDSRLCPNAFLVSDFMVTHHFAARDHMEKLFWMQTIAKMLRQLVAIHEHALNAKSALQHHTSSSNNSTHLDSDDEDEEDDEEDEEKVKDSKRPPQVRRESMYRYYGLKLPPKDDAAPLPLTAAATTTTTTSTGESRLLRVQQAVAKSLGSSNQHQKKSTPPTDALTVFYQDAEAPWVDADLDRLIRVAKLTSTAAAGGATAKVSFGQLAKAWGDKEADALEGILLKAKRKGIAKYQGDMLFKDYDDAVVVEVKI